MKILVVADVPDKKYWDYYTDGCLSEFDLILSCGDLPPQYLTFLVTMAKCPVVYVPGNHDDIYKSKPPEGCICCDGDIVKVCGLRILGLGGSNRYKLGDNQYTQKEMYKRIKKLNFRLRKNKGFDILLAHSPARFLNDSEDIPHQGFEAFNDLMDKYAPKFFIHGHVHMNYNYKLPRICAHGQTTVINGYRSFVIETE